MATKSCSITTGEKHLLSSRYTLYFECAGCMLQMCAMIVLGKDGIAQFYYRRTFYLSNWLQYKAVSVPTEGVKASISCGFCGHAYLDCHLSRSDDGTSSIELSSPDEVTKDIAPSCSCPSDDDKVICI